MLAVLVGATLALCLFVAFFYATDLSPTVWGVVTPLRMGVFASIVIVGVLPAWLLEDSTHGLIMIPIGTAAGYLAKKIATTLRLGHARDLFAELLILHASEQRMEQMLVLESITQLMWTRLYLDILVASPGMFVREQLVGVRLAINDELLRRGLAPPP
jgi:hypothetical protein